MAVALSVGCGAPKEQLAFKGYELYSFQKDGNWYFSLLQGTNRLKSFEEITADNVAKQGVDSITRELGRLGKGEQVFWTVGNMPGLSYPPQSVMKRINDYCEQKGIKLNIP